MFSSVSGTIDHPGHIIVHVAEGNPDQEEEEEGKSGGEPSARCVHSERVTGALRLESFWLNEQGFDSLLLQCCVVVG